MPLRTRALVLGALTLSLLAGACSSSTATTTGAPPSTTAASGTTAAAAKASFVYPDAEWKAVDPATKNIDPATLKVVNTFKVGLYPQHVVPSWDLKTLYVTARTSLYTISAPVKGHRFPGKK